MEIQKEYFQNNHRDIYNLSCFSSFYNQINKEKLTFIDENILVDSVNSKSQGFVNLINELTNEDYEGEEFKYDDW